MAGRSWSAAKHKDATKMDELTITTGAASITFVLTTWLLGVSFLLGKYAARVESVQAEVKTLVAKLDTIGDKIDRIAVSAIHVCIQSDRITRLETKAGE
jgi:hypothetical protein